MSLAGCLYQAGGRYLLRAEGANVTFEVRGNDLARYNGQRVAVAASPLPGEKPTAGAAQTIQVTQIKSLGGGCGAADSKDKDTENAGDPATRKAMSGKTRAVIAGVAVATAVGGATVGLTRDEKAPSSSISR